MRKRLVVGNLVVTLVVGALGFALARAGVGVLPLSIALATLLVLLSSVHAIAVLNGLLRDLTRVEEAALRVSFGESGVRVGQVASPYDGLASRMDQVFEMLDEATKAGIADAEPERASSNQTQLS